MIGYIRGRILFFEADQVVIDTGGVGYILSVPPQVFSLDVGSEVELYVSTQMSEDRLQLFGFLRIEQKRLFELLKKTSGVGAKKAMGVLAVMEPANFVQAVLSDRWQELTRVPGIGAKTAKRMVLELKDKVMDLGITPEAADENLLQMKAALEALGYSSSEISKTVEKLKNRAKDIELAELIREAIALLSKK